MHIDFERLFVSAPKVVPFFNYIDLCKDHGWRIYTAVSDIDTDDSTLTIDTWSDTILYTAQAGWFAYPTDGSYKRYDWSANTVSSFLASTIDISGEVTATYTLGYRSLKLHRSYLRSGSASPNYVFS